MFILYFKKCGYLYFKINTEIASKCLFNLYYKNHVFERKTTLYCAEMRLLIKIIFCAILLCDKPDVGL